jgi:hypothetical protein
MVGCCNKSLVTAASVLLCGALSVAFYLFVAAKVTKGDDDKAVPRADGGMINEDTGGGFRLVENINIPQSQHSLLNVIVGILGTGIAGVVMWVAYRKWISFRAASTVPPDMPRPDMCGPREGREYRREYDSPPPTYSSAMRGEQAREMHGESRPHARNPEVRRYRMPTRNIPFTREPIGRDNWNPCPHHDAAQELTDDEFGAPVIASNVSSPEPYAGRSPRTLLEARSPPTYSHIMANIMYSGQRHSLHR